MKSSISPSVLRASIALAMGFVLIKWPDLAVDYIIIAMGIIFLIPGIMGLILYYKNRKHQNVKFPLESIGSLLFGVCLVIVPTFFANIVTVLLGAVLLLGGVQQISSLFSARKYADVNWSYYIIPVIIFLSGLYVLLYPSDARATTLIVIGVAWMLYGLFELVKWIMFVRNRPIDADIVEYIEDETGK